MKDRIQEFLKVENKSSAQLAEEIGVQPSGISHILSGRNNPSLDFVLKMLEKYRYLSTDWLLFGKGEMYKDYQSQTLFSEHVAVRNETSSRVENLSLSDNPVDLQDIKNRKKTSSDLHLRPSEMNKVVKIVWFYENNSFEEYYPRN